MTREEWQMQMLILTHVESDAEHFNAALHTLEAWDIAQRMKIEHQAKEIARLENGLGCSRSHPHEDMNQICELRTEVARLKNELSHWTWVRFKQLEEESATLREALKALLSENEDYVRINNLSAMGNVNLVAARQALKEQS